MCISTYKVYTRTHEGNKSSHYNRDMTIVIDEYESGIQFFLGKNV